MIDATLSLIAAQLDQQLKRHCGVTGELVQLAEPGARGGNPANRVFLFLAGVERDANGQRGAETGTLGSTARFQAYNPIRYLPSVLHRVRMVTQPSAPILNREPVIRSMETEVR